MYMKCETCEKKLCTTYELCGTCFGIKPVVESHWKSQSKYGEDGKHVFKANLYRRSEASGLLGLDDHEETDLRKLQEPQPENTSSKDTKLHIDNEMINYMQSDSKGIALASPELEHEYLNLSRKDLEKRADRIALWSDLSLGDSAFLSEAVKFQKPEAEERN